MIVPWNIVELALDFHGKRCGSIPSAPGSTMLPTLRGSGTLRLSSFGRSAGFNIAIVFWE
jgi:hypothetical protein